MDAYGQYHMDSLDENEQFQKLWKWWKAELMGKARGEDMMRKGYYTNQEGERVDGELGCPWFRRMGWQTKNNAIFTDNRRMILPLYSDGFSFSLMALTDDQRIRRPGSHMEYGPGFTVTQ